MGVVIFKGKGKCNNVHIAEGFSRFEGFQPVFRGWIVFRQEGSFTNDVIIAVEQTVKCLKTQIGHADMVPVGIYQGYPDPSAPGFADRTDFGLCQFPVKFVRFRYHQSARCAVRNGVRDLLQVSLLIRIR